MSAFIRIRRSGSSPRTAFRFAIRLMNGGACFRRVSSALVITLLLISTGCEEPTEPIRTATCAALNGSYVSTFMSAQSITNPDVADDFEDAVWQIDFSGATFESLFARPRRSVIVNGTASASAGNAGQIILGSEPLLPGMEPGAQSFRCDVEDDSFNLRAAELGYDFDGNGTFESAQFEARFVSR